VQLERTEEGLGYFQDVVAVSDSGHVAFMLRDGIRVFDAEGRPLGTYLLPPLADPKLWSSYSVAFVSDDVLAWADSVRGGGLLLRSTGELLSASGEPLALIAVDTARKRIAFQRRASIALYDAVAREWIAELDVPDYCVVAFLPDGKQIATASADRRIVIWEID
jgi:hypothetical protein